MSDGSRFLCAVGVENRRKIDVCDAIMERPAKADFSRPTFPSDPTSRGWFYCFVSPWGDATPEFSAPALCLSWQR